MGTPHGKCSCTWMVQKFPTKECNIRAPTRPKILSYILHPPQLSVHTHMIFVSHMPCSVSSHQVLNLCSACRGKMQFERGKDFLKYLNMCFTSQLSVSSQRTHSQYWKTTTILALRLERSHVSSQFSMNSVRLSGQFNLLLPEMSYPSPSEIPCGTRYKQ